MLKYGEAIVKTLQREAQEELGYVLSSNPQFTNLYQFIARDGSQHVIILHYLVLSDVKPAIKLGDDEARSTVHWLTRPELAGIAPDLEFLDAVFTPTMVH